ncbi:hypothetical protein P153DRAFT_38788 [Dothidotthia symphoricarpi CBS 119687]|uniref:Secreted protein n=1 Tax=Dothidotthia symphoricarpi CBS 119687 TaxID=1392245 RepID=A0A6A6AC59_9PLEO|nr:uncharacterized protein P153DRAFT_38788 [Dothidotthia symphoricarpi CBS 119687]KAF2128488.1 hypothetical protein P153DRAFT_38788 [Dothidotthia symphoricarpi CBS 119687]
MQMRLFVASWLVVVSAFETDYFSVFSRTNQHLQSDSRLATPRIVVVFILLIRLNKLLYVPLIGYL